MIHLITLMFAFTIQAQTNLFRLIQDCVLQTGKVSREAINWASDEKVIQIVCTGQQAKALFDAVNSYTVYDIASKGSVVRAFGSYVSECRQYREAGEDRYSCGIGVSLPKLVYRSPFVANDVAACVEQSGQLLSG